MIGFKCTPIWISYFFGFGEGENGLGDEGADGNNALLPRIFGLESPLVRKLYIENAIRDIVLRSKVKIWKLSGLMKPKL